MPNKAFYNYFSQNKILLVQKCFPSELGLLEGWVTKRTQPSFAEIWQMNFQNTLNNVFITILAFWEKVSISWLTVFSFRALQRPMKASAKSKRDQSRRLQESSDVIIWHVQLSYCCLIAEYKLKNKFTVSHRHLCTINGCSTGNISAIRCSVIKLYTCSCLIIILMLLYVW